MQRVTIGDVEVLPLQDAAMLMNPHVFMPQHAGEWLAETPDLADERGLMPMSVTCFLVRSAGKTILVDTGLGPRRRPGFPRAHLDEALREAGVAPGDVDIVVNTHLHIDHVGWNTVDTEDGRRVPFFPRARWIVQRVEWEHWVRPQFLEAEGNAHLRECVVPLGEQGRVDLVTPDAPLDEHLTFVPSPGHTPGHVAVGIASQGERAIIIGDASHHPIQLTHPDWSPSFDTDPLLAARTRDRLFDDAADDGRLWLAGHWPYPGIGRILRVDGKRMFRAL
jgi:glyoxylase-like metal-dependent hydrolase (beta-lactamase superfamily II)